MKHELVRLWNNLDQAYGMGNLALCLFGTLFILWAFTKASSEDAKTTKTMKKEPRIRIVSILSFCTSFFLGICATYIVMTQFEKGYAINLVPGFTNFIDNLLRIA